MLHANDSIAPVLASAPNRSPGRIGAAVVDEDDLGGEARLVGCLEKALGELGSGTSTPRLQLARTVEQTAEELLAARHPERPLRANVEFYTAVLLEAVGLPRELFTATFAVGRVAGWCAHVAEQRRTGKLIRPAARYVGRAVARTSTP